MKIALIENKSDEFYNSRLKYALFLKERGNEVIAILPNNECQKEIENAGVKVISLDLDVRQRSLKTVLTYWHNLKSIFKNECFDVIHFYRLQPNLLGTPIAFFNTKNSKCINHITGLGIAFAKNSWKYKFLRFITKLGYNVNYHLFGAELILQNEDDKIELGNKKKFHVVKGSAVDENRFNPEVRPSLSLAQELKKHSSFSDSSLKLLYVSRLVRIKGLSYLVKAVERYNKSAQRKVELFIAGWIDPRNPDSFSQEEIKEFDKVGGVHFLGKRNDIHLLLSYVDIAILPSYYREGTPRFMLEAMAMAKPIITTNMPGCNHLIPKNKNGKLIEPKSTCAIIEAFKWFENKNINQLGRESYKLYKQEFSEEIIYNQLIDIYEKT